MLSQRSIHVAQAASVQASRRLLRMFKPWPHISREDLVQVAMMGILTAHYDLSKSAFPTFCYQVAYRRILDHWDSVKCRGVQAHISHVDEWDARVESAPGYRAGAIDLLQAADACPFPMKGARGRPWRFNLRQRLEIAERRKAGESWGQIAVRYRTRRSTVQRVIASMSTVERRLGNILRPAPPELIERLMDPADKQGMRTQNRRAAIVAASGAGIKLAN